LDNKVFDIIDARCSQEVIAPHSMCSTFRTQNNVTVVITNALMMPGEEECPPQVAWRTYAAALCLCDVKRSPKKHWLIQRSSPGCWWIGFVRRSDFVWKICWSTSCNLTV